MDWENLSDQLIKASYKYDIQHDVLLAAVYCLYTIPLDGDEDFVISHLEKDRMKNKILRYMRKENEK
jgi:hypothetical protein